MIIYQNHSSQKRKTWIDQINDLVNEVDELIYQKS